MRRLGLAVHSAQQPTCKKAPQGARLGGAQGRWGLRRSPPWRRRGGRARLPGWRAAEVPRSWSEAGAAAASRRRAVAAAGRTGGRAELGSTRQNRRDAAGLTGPDEAEGEAASAGGGAGAGGPGPSAQRGAVGAVPRTAARRHPRGIRGGGAPCGRTGESLTCHGVENILSLKIHF